jgi:single-stranded-DNA-specific exonuclease
MPAISCDLEVDPAEVTLDLLHELESFEPWGSGNEEAVFVSRGLTILEVKRIGKELQHLKLSVRSSGMSPTEALVWREGEMADRIAIGSMVDLCYKPEINRFNGRETVQFNVIDLGDSESDMSRPA